MVLTETEKRDWETILAMIKPCMEGETDEQKTARFDQHAHWLASAIYYLQKACNDLSNLRDERVYRDNVSGFKEAANSFVEQLENAVMSLGDDAAQYAFKNAVSFAHNRIDEEKQEQNDGK